MRVVVVGAGAWGLPAGAELARRGHEVTVVDRFGVGNPWSSSSGATRLWRLAHTDPADVRLALASVRAWRDLERRTSRTLLLTRGLLWRGADVARVAAALAAEGVDHSCVDATDVGRFFPGLRPNGLDAVWQPAAGPLLAAEALDAQAAVLRAAGGRLVTATVTAIDVGTDTARVTLDRRSAGRPSDDLASEAGADLLADVVVVAAGPWAPVLLTGLGVAVPLVPGLGQVTHLTGRDGWADLPCLIDGQQGDVGGSYALPTPGVGYKIGFRHAVRAFDPADLDRTPDPAEQVRLVARAADLGFDHPVVGPGQLCSWTDSDDGEFVLDRVHGGRVVVATGDTGHGFKFSAVLGRWLADLVEGRDLGPDVARFGIARLGV
jgi:sarcosine oxidase